LKRFRPSCISIVFNSVTQYIILSLIVRSLKSKLTILVWFINSLKIMRIYKSNGGKQKGITRWKLQHSSKKEQDILSVLMQCLTSRFGDDFIFSFLLLPVLVGLQVLNMEWKLKTISRWRENYVAGWLIFLHVSSEPKVLQKCLYLEYYSLSFSRCLLRLSFGYLLIMVELR
jgi:hypothetical protein